MSSFSRVVENEKGEVFFPFRLVIYFLTASFLAAGIGLGFTDDGLRHLAYAENRDLMGSWGEVFPLSLFGEYDPWDFWHRFLGVVIDISSYEFAHVVVNIISIFILLTLVDLALLTQLKRFQFLVSVISILITIYSYERYIVLRPDLISGFFVLAIFIFSEKINQNKRFLAVLLLSLAYAPMYYLFFVYTAALGMYMFLIKDFKSVMALAVATILGFSYYYMHFGVESLETIGYILQDESLRDGMNVNEGLPLIQALTVLNVKVLFILYLLLIYYFFSKHQKFLLENKLFTLILTLSLLWIGQLRYTSLFMPIFTIFFVSLFMNLSMSEFDKIIKQIRVLFVNGRRIVLKKKKMGAFVGAIALFVGFEISVIEKHRFSDTKDAALEYIKEMKKPEYKNKRILVNTLDNIEYYSLYASPSLEFIPSCSIGWTDGGERVDRLYKELIKNGLSVQELKELSLLVKADYIFFKPSKGEKIGINLDNLNDRSFKILKTFKDFLIIEVKIH